MKVTCGFIYTYSYHQCLRVGPGDRAVNTLGKKKKCFPYRTQILVGIYVAGRGEQMRRKINRFLKHIAFPPCALGKVEQERQQNVGGKDFSVILSVEVDSLTEKRMLEES